MDFLSSIRPIIVELEKLETSSKHFFREFLATFQVDIRDERRLKSEIICWNFGRAPNNEVKIFFFAHKRNVFMGKLRLLNWMRS